MCMPIIGKISEGNLTFLITLKNHARNGLLSSLYQLTREDVKMSTSACLVMDGKNKSTTQKTTSSIFVSKVNHAKRTTVSIVT